MSGSTIADVSAIGGTMIPPMTARRLQTGAGGGIVSAASAMGMLVPPCILMIVIASIANVSVSALFLAGFIPAVVLAAFIMGYIYYRSSASGVAPPARPSLGRCGAASWMR